MVFHSVSVAFYHFALSRCASPTTKCNIYTYLLANDEPVSLANLLLQILVCAQCCEILNGRIELSGNKMDFNELRAVLNCFDLLLLLLLYIDIVYVYVYIYMLCYLFFSFLFIAIPIGCRVLE